MKAYADTSFLVRLLVRDADNAAADAAHRKIGGPFLIYTPYHNLEVTNALRLRTFMAGHGSGPATKRQAKREEAEALRRLKNCLTTGRFLDPPCLGKLRLIVLSGCPKTIVTGSECVDSTSFMWRLPWSGPARISLLAISVRLRWPKRLG